MDNKNITANIYRIQVNDSIRWLDYSNLFSLNKYEENVKKY